MSTGPCEDLHQFHAGSEIPRQTFSTYLHIKPLTELRFLCCDTNGAVIGITHARGDTANSLHRGITYRDCISTHCHRFDEVFGDAQTTRYDKRDFATCLGIEMCPCTRKCGYRGYRDVVAKN